MELRFPSILAWHLFLLKRFRLFSLSSVLKIDQFDFEWLMQIRFTNGNHFKMVCKPKLDIPNFHYVHNTYVGRYFMPKYLFHIKWVSLFFKVIQRDDPSQTFQRRDLKLYRACLKMLESNYLTKMVLHC